MDLDKMRSNHAHGHRQQLKQQQYNCYQQSTGLPCVVRLLGDEANSCQSRAHVSEEVLAWPVGACSGPGPTSILPQIL